MISVILAGLMTFAQPNINFNYVYNQTLVDLTDNVTIQPKYMDAGGNSETIYGFHVDFDDFVPVNSVHYITIKTQAGDIPLEFRWNVRSDGAGGYEYFLHMKYFSDESILSNVFISNFSVEMDLSGDIYNLPNVYFNGSEDIMQSTAYNNYIFTYYTNDDNLRYDFDLMIMPSDMIVNPYAYENGYNDGYTNGQTAGKTEGYREGFNDGRSISSQGTFQNLFNALADTPLRFLYGLFSFDLFGTSMLVIVLTLLTGIMIFGLIKKFWK